MIASGRELAGTVGWGSAPSSVPSRDRGGSEERRARGTCGSNRDRECCSSPFGALFSGGKL
ncbi:uncharacterized protein BJ212DRAFT_1397281 [Suillus subaureus]|uniref:Uncharacterized protein n=1 Tax=Suillus subaureus TaxID=48587 RepID=A0A9P7DT38_9AGAM|nr:uncharacterized protein BJ212DRAFT_1397281 [Suillus subaureus]KAG1802539.1 hypothetical protein BJ212DRAFT_1397281 [Suillus subaureus]